ncbi:MAG: LD-carboxypeptidase [Blautia sp.]|nr:LD-carboxypeptidase [Blautia sp.]MCM1199955.1 LD-carboxypeptidase [Bacteroides fragilis]
MRYPAFLPSNGIIGFVAPSFGCATEPYKSAFLNAQKKWEKEGYKLRLGPNCYVERGIGISNTPPECGKELQDFYCSKENDCLISCGGGELMCEILDHIDFDQIGQATPKWYMGYSDNTNMTFLLTTLCDTASVYGPCAATFGMEPWHPSLYDAMDLLTGKCLELQGYDKWEKEAEEGPYAPYHLTEPSVIRKFPDRTLDFSGRLLGGCMDCLVNLLGTEYDKVCDFTGRYREDGVIWFLEACDLNVMGIRRAMWQMEHAGWFRHCKGFLIGRPLCYGQEMMGLDQYQAVYEVVQKYDVPVLMDLDIGHIAPMMPLICGSIAQVHAEGNQYTVKMELK